MGFMETSLHEREPGLQEIDVESPGGRPGLFETEDMLMCFAAAFYPSRANFRMNAMARMYISGLIFLNFPLIMLTRT